MSRSPQFMVLWMTPVLMGAAAVLSMVFNEPELLGPRICIAGLLGLSFSKTLTHQPFDGDNRLTFAALQGLYFGVFLAAMSTGHDNYIGLWIYLLISGGLYGGFHYISITPASTAGQAELLRPYYTEVVQDGPLVRFWPLGVLALALVMTLATVPPLWITLAMAIALCGTPARRNIHPDHDIAVFHWALPAVAALLAGGAAYTLTTP